MYFMHRAGRELDRQLASLKDCFMNYEIYGIAEYAWLAEILALRSSVIHSSNIISSH